MRKYDKKNSKNYRSDENQKTALYTLNISK